MYRSGAHTVYLIGYIKCVPNRVPSLDLLSAEPMSYKARLGARFVYPIGYYMYVPDRVHNSLYPPSFQGLLEFCGQVFFTPVVWNKIVVNCGARFISGCHFIEAINRMPLIV